jgi:aspartyl-tRNA(Asn)/glutamyl-tRNA(Gln) amidotransferase subunit B
MTGDRKYILTVGLEVHANVKTRTKMFCGCLNDLDEREPNKNTCPICLAHPGVLPTMNEEAVRKVIQFGCAVHGVIAKDSWFDRKSYFYPDLPKGYQISQYDHPLVEGGEIRGVRLTRVHLEEDAGRLQHSDDGSTLVDFNRAGVPLMELVTEPDITTADQAVAFAQELQLILKYLDVSDADMEKGQMRVEANISIRPDESLGLDQSEGLVGRTGLQSKPVLGVKVEVKNINSFKAVAGAIEYEVKRQSKLLDEGKPVVQETRGWNDVKNITESQRSKESAHDYRYFPEPDLPPLDLRSLDLEDIKRHLPELPDAKRERFATQFGLNVSQIEWLVGDKSVAAYFEAAASELKERVPGVAYQTLANYFTSDLRGLLKTAGIHITEVKVPPEHFAHFIALVEDGTLSSRLAKDLLAQMVATGEDPETLMQKSGVKVMSDTSELGAVVDAIIAANPKVVEDYRKGKGNALQFLIGQGMARTKGQADPAVLQKIFAEKLG